MISIGENVLFLRQLHHVKRYDIKLCLAHNSLVAPNAGMHMRWGL